MTISLRLLAEDILLSLNGGQPLTAPPPLPIRQVRLWCAEAIAAVFRAKLDAYEQQGRVLPDEWSTGFTLPVTFQSTFAPTRRFHYAARLPGSIHNPIVRMGEVALPLVENAFAAHAGKPYGKWQGGKAVASLRTGNLRVSLPMTDGAIEAIEVEGFLLPDPELLLDNVDLSLGVPLPWLAEIKAAVLQKGALVLGQGQDTISNAATGPADRTPRPA